MPDKPTRESEEYRAARRILNNAVNTGCEYSIKMRGDNRYYGYVIHKGVVIATGIGDTVEECDIDLAAHYLPLHKQVAKYAMK